MDRPILFSGPMIRALVEGRKTQTRRLLYTLRKSKKPMAGIHAKALRGYDPPDATTHAIDEYYDLREPYSVGDRLWVREATAEVHPLAVQEGRFNIEGRAGIPGPPKVSYRRVYRADGDVLQVWHADEYPFRQLSGPRDTIEESFPTVCSEWVGRLKYQPWTPGIHMPRCASRLTLTVCDVRIERLQDLSEEDAKAEGADAATANIIMSPEERQSLASVLIIAPDVYHRVVFETLWEQIHGHESWPANPWVAVTSFTAELRNIDMPRAA